MAARKHGTVHRSSGRERLTPEHCYILQLWGLPEDNSCSIARARVRPGVTTAWHSLRGIREWYLVAEGRGRVEVGHRKPVPVRRGALVPIPAGMRQRITNTGRGDLVFYCLCRPAFRQRAYVNLERPQDVAAARPLTAHRSSR
jgi:mannose-6-phosphate isomerase-like protein (cupin superfamily)